jgi:hypothetical protein
MPYEEHGDMEDHRAPPEAALLELVFGKFVSRAIATAANLGVADVIAGGVHEVEDIAAKVNVPADPLYRMLRALTVVGIFEELPGKRFENTEVGALLRSDAPTSMRAMAQWIGCDAGWLAWSGLDHSVKTGAPGFDEVHGAQVFEYFAKHPETGRIFHAAMTSLSAYSGHAVAKAYDFREVGKLVDVGGGHGLMAEAIAQATPGLEVLVYDLPEVVRTAPAREGVRFEGGDFFERVPADADAYIMKSILHDWDDERAARILMSCASAMKPGGRVLVVEQVISDDPRAALGKLADLEMLVMTSGGRERTEPELRALFARASLELVRVLPTDSPYSVLEGRHG